LFPPAQTFMGYVRSAGKRNKRQRKNKAQKKRAKMSRKSRRLSGFTMSFFQVTKGKDLVLHAILHFRL